MSYMMLCIGVLILDIITKLWAELALKGAGSFAVIEGLFHFTYVENRGIAFGMFSNARIWFILVSIVVLIALVVLFCKSKNRTVWLKLGTSLVIGGAVGNLIERMSKGYVVDFLDFRFINFPVFNIADIAVCAGAVMIMLHFFAAERLLKREETASGADVQDVEEELPHDENEG